MGGVKGKFPCFSEGYFAVWREGLASQSSASRPERAAQWDHRESKEDQREKDCANNQKQAYFEHSPLHYETRSNTPFLEAI